MELLNLKQMREIVNELKKHGSNDDIIAISPIALEDLKHLQEANQRLKVYKDSVEGVGFCLQKPLEEQE